MICIFVSAQVSKTIDVSTAGTLSTLLTDNEMSTITNFTITGNLDKRDFWFIRDKIPLLTNLNIEQVNIKEYIEDSEKFVENQLPRAAFYECMSLKDIKLPNSISAINSQSFRACKSLTNINIPNSLNAIEPDAFLYCEKLLEINVDNGSQFYTSLNGVLYNKNQTEVIIVPGGKMGEIVLKSNVSKIGSFAFWGCKYISTVVIPNSVLSIGEQAFTYSGLTTLQIPNSITKIETGTFKNCNYLSSITIPNSVTTIKDEAFMRCENLKTLIIPNSVTSIGEYVFYKLYSLKSLYSYMQNPMVLSSKAFEYTNKANCTLYVPKESRYKYIQTTGWNYFLDIVEFDATTSLKTSSSNDLEINYNSVSKSIILRGIDKPYSIAIYDINGVLCYLNELKEPNQNIYTVGLAQGIYIVKVTVNNEVISRKIQVF